MDLIEEMIELVRAEVTAPGTNQSRGAWNDRGDCCTGSRIAHALGVPSGMYLDGIDEWASRMGMTRVQIIAMLQDAGASQDPIGPGRWPEPPGAVWRRLAEVQEPPTLAGRDLSRLNLAGTGLQGLDLNGCNLEGANLRGARLENANLSFARMREADLRRASLRHADLAGSDLTGTDLAGADLTGAHIRGVRLAGAKVAGARTEGTRPRWVRSKVMDEPRRGQ